MHHGATHGNAQRSQVRIRHDVLLSRPRQYPNIGQATAGAMVTKLVGAV